MNDKELWPPNTITYNAIWFFVTACICILAGGMYYGLSVRNGSAEDFTEAIFLLTIAACFFICTGLVMLRKRLVIYVLVLMGVGVVLYGTVLGHDLPKLALASLGIYIWQMIALLKKGELV